MNSFSERIKLMREDITQLKVDAIVNAANNSLLGGGGVDGAIHRVAGPKLLEECRMFKGCSTGQAKITKAYNLPAKFVIHTVGPVWKGGQNNEEKLLVSCYQNSLKLAIDYNLKTVAFPNISTGVYHFPKEKAARIAIETVNNFLAGHKIPEKIYFICFDEENYKIYEQLLSTMHKKKRDLKHPAF